jgi:predicted dehydrogenase
LNICSSASFNNCHRLEFYGDQGVMILQNLTEDYIRGFELFFGDCDGKNLCSVECGEDLSHNADGRIQVVSRLVKRFLDAILTGSAQRPNLVDGLRVQQLIEAAKESMKNRRWVECS